MSEIYIPLNSFFAEKISMKDLLQAISIVGKSKASGIEIRRELLREQDLLSVLQNIQPILHKANLTTVYSAPIPIWNSTGFINEQALQTIFEECNCISAKWVKLPLGHYMEEKSDLQSLWKLLKDHPNVSLLVENDQTMEGGKIQPLAAFFENASKLEMPVEMTFDIGNWAFQQEDAYEAFQIFQPYIFYFHLKHVVKQDNLFFTVPLPPEQTADWRKMDQCISASIPRALEFPLERSMEEINKYIDIIQSNQGRENSHAIN
ncbi:sugar phosphate isomerase/epimerase family protein [Niallia sp. JL1B1071]|uniref:sugar phosphate isomerase/epimerase family protein n=1 Tax=Niallia tiangongensis TaxID=3237105 RepID=UPI0037DBFB6D